MPDSAVQDGPADTSSKSPNAKDFDNISDMEISDKEDDEPRKKIVTHGLGSLAAEKDNISDAESDLTDISDLDEELDDLADIDEDLAGVRDRPEVDLDQDAVRKMGVHRRARGEAAGGQKKKEVSRRSRKPRDGDAPGADGESGERSAKPARPLTENELKLKALDSKIEKATKAPSRKRKQDGDSTLFDEAVANLKDRMKVAAKLDADDKDAGKPATRKLNMLNEVLDAFRQKELKPSIADSNLLEAVRFWLEPLPDKSLPAYDIQRDLFQMLLDMPEIDYDMLRQSGLGKLLTFYIRDARPQQHIRITAQKLYENWSRPILEKSSNYRDRKIEVAEYDIISHKRTRPKLSSLKDKPDALAPPQLKANRTRVPDATPQTYTIAPRSKVPAANPATARPLGATAEDSIRRLKARASGKMGGRGAGKGAA